MLEKAWRKRSADISKDRREMILSLLTIGSISDWDQRKKGREHEKEQLRII